MATRDTLTPKEAQCSGGADYAALALEALQEPADAAYAKELMDRVADDCQFTKDLAACAIVYKALGEQDRAEERRRAGGAGGSQVQGAGRQGGGGGRV
jgi:Tfp pilus assembly protein PilF